MKCKYCLSEIESEITQIMENWGVIKESRCPKCHMILSVTMYALNKQKGWKQVGEVLKNNKYKKWNQTKNGKSS
jgi:hypothetical protein